MLPAILVLQSLVSVGAILGFSFLLPNLDGIGARYLATGGPTLALISIGLIGVPQNVAQSRVDGTLEYWSTLPLSRLAEVATQMTVILLTAIPGMILSLVVASMRFDFTLRPHVLLLPSIVLVSTTAAALGYSLALSVKHPTLVTLASNALLFGTLLFSPINYPTERLPGWLASLHAWLPFEPMGRLIRETLVGGGSGLGRSFGVLSAWCVIALVITWRALTRRA